LESPSACRLALSFSTAVVELPVTILIVAAANVGDQCWRVGDFVRQRWRFSTVRFNLSESVWARELADRFF